MRICDFFKQRAEENLKEAVNTLEERSQHARQHIHNISERLNSMEQRIDKLIDALEKAHK